MSADPAPRSTTFLFSGEGWPYLLVPLIPVAVVLEFTHAGATWVFLASALGVIPTAALMGRATEELAARSGPGIGGFLNVTFGNAPELIIACSRSAPACTRSSRLRWSGRSWATSCW
jgi:Ca2+:H+ antiporter